MEERHDVRGIDVGKNRCRAAITNREGVKVNEFSFNNDQAGISHFASMLTMDMSVKS